MKQNKIWLLALLLCAGCSKSKDNVKPVAETHAVTFYSTGAGYTVALRLQKSNQTYPQSMPLDSISTTSNLYMYTLSLKPGEHLLIKVGPGTPPEALLHYAINDNGVPKDSVNISNIPPGVEMILHYPKD
jgi:hypothetical protein